VKTPNSPPLLLLAARTYATKGDNGRAEELLKRAVEIDPSFIQAYGVLGQLYVGQGKLDDARAEFQRLASARPDDVAASTMVGMLLEGQGKNDDAKKVYGTIYDRNPKAAVAANNLAFILAQEGTDLDRALNLAQAAKAQMPDDPTVSDTLGWVYYKKDLASLAIEPLEFSVRKDPSHAAFQYHLGFAYLRKGDKANGTMWLNRALNLDPNSPMAVEARKALAS
jgi:predicted Zn-dependent protease